MKRIRIEVFGADPPCAKCKATVRLAEQVAREFGDTVEVKEYTAFSEEGDKYNIMMTPTVVVNSKVFATGKMPSKEELQAVIKRELGGE